MYCNHCKQEIKDGVRFCPHCGKKVKVKSPRKLIIWPFFAILAGVTLVAAIVVTLRAALWDPANVPQLIKQGTVNCFVEHQWVDATCVRPSHCSICGLETGDVAEHQWIDATCQQPQTCSVCGATEGKLGDHVWEKATCLSPKQCTVCGKKSGSKLGHTTNYGTCSRCGEYIDKLSSPLTTIGNRINDALDDIASAIAYLKLANNGGYNCSAYLAKAYDEMIDAYNDLRDAKSSSSNHSELTKLTSKLGQAVSSFENLADQMPSSVWDYEVPTYSLMISKCIKEIDNYITEATSIAQNILSNPD